MKWYVAYDGDRCIGVFDSIEHLAKAVGCTVGTAQTKAAPSRKNSDRGLVVERVNDDEDD